MSESYSALSSDWYVNSRLALKLDLPRRREEVLDMFERLRRQFPGMIHFRRHRDELSLESEPEDGQHAWVAIRPTSVRAGTLNPSRLSDGYPVHRTVLETAPFYLSISPLDVDYHEVTYAFELLAGGSHDEIVLEALMAGSPIARALDIPGSRAIDCQPVFGVALDPEGQTEAVVEVKTRPPERGRPAEDRTAEPISVFLTMRRYGPVKDIRELPAIFDALAVRGEELVESRVIPHLVVPIRDAIASGS
jgi:hypothetical protein